MMISDKHIGEALCNSRSASSNLIPYFTFEELGNLNIHAFHGDVGLANGKLEKAGGIIYDLP